MIPMLRVSVGRQKGHSVEENKGFHLLLNNFICKHITSLLFTFTFMQTLLSNATYSTFRLYIFFISMCVPWESNPQPFALLTQCSTTEPAGTLWLFYVPNMQSGVDIVNINGPANNPTKGLN